ncbi:uncharacterized protein [Ptychodera flava]
MKMSQLPPRPQTVADTANIIRPGMIRSASRAGSDWFPGTSSNYRMPPKSAHAKSVAFTLPNGATALPEKERPQSVGAIKLNSEGLPVLMETSHAKNARRPYRSPSAPEISSQRIHFLGNRTLVRKGSFPIVQRPHTSDGNVTSEYLKQRARREFEEAAARANDFCKRAHQEEFFFRATEVPQDVELITARVASGRVLLDTTPNGIASAKEQSYFVDPLVSLRTSQTAQGVAATPSFAPKTVSAGPRQRFGRRLQSRSSNSSATSSPIRDRLGDVHLDTEVSVGDNSSDVTPLDGAEKNDSCDKSDKKMQDVQCKVSQWLETVDQFQGIDDDMDKDTYSDIRTTEIKLT